MHGAQRRAVPTPLVGAAILLLAALLRFPLLDRLPGGLHFDLAANLFDVVEILDGARPLYFPRNTGREPLVIYMQAASALIFGPTPLAAKMVTAVWGMVSVAAAGFAARQAVRLARPDEVAGAELVALTAAGCMAGLFWSVYYSRFGLRTGAMPALLALAVGFELRGLRLVGQARRAWPQWLAAGAWLGLAVDTYIGGRIAPAVLALPVLAAWLLDRRPIWIGRLALMAAAATVVAAPVILFYAAQPSLFLEHRGDVFVFNRGDASGGGLLRGLLVTAGAYVLRGSPGIAENLPGRPMFDPLAAVALLVGLGTVLLWARSRRGLVPAVAMLGWLVVMSLPAGLTVPAPTMGRLSGAIAGAAVVVGVGAWALATRLAPGRWRWLLPVALVALSTAWTARDYFVLWRTRYAYDAMQTAKADAARWLLAREPTDRVFMAPLWAGDYAVQFLTRQGPLGRFAGSGLVIPTDRARGAIYGFPPEQESAAEEMRGRLPAGASTQLLRDATGQHDVMWIVRLPPAALPVPPRERQRLEDGTALVGVDYPRQAAAGARVEIALQWLAVAQPSRDYTVFVQLRRDGVTRAQHDGQPIDGVAPTTTWRPGDLIRDPHPLTLPPDLPPGQYGLFAGLYDLETGARLHLLDGAGQPAPSDELRLGDMVVGPAA